MANWRGCVYRKHTLKICICTVCNTKSRYQLSHWVQNGKWYSKVILENSYITVYGSVISNELLKYNYLYDFIIRSIMCLFTCCTCIIVTIHSVYNTMLPYFYMQYQDFVLLHDPWFVFYTMMLLVPPAYGKPIQRVVTICWVPTRH